MSLMMALVMAVPMSVSAAEKPVTDKAGLLEAINNAANGDVITVSGNIECDTAVNIIYNILSKIPIIFLILFKCH